VFFEHKHFYEGDRKHLHFRLLDIGLTQCQAVLLLYLLTLIFGASALFLQSQSKVLAMGVLILVMVILGVWLTKKYKRNSKSEARNSKQYLN
jgi:UDP-GlcNAc:undecaprenyl-phosphate GlcNAc-1-phosphate transferase